MWNPRQGLMPIDVESLKSAIKFPPEVRPLLLVLIAALMFPTLSPPALILRADRLRNLVSARRGLWRSGSINVADHSLTHGGTELESCVVTNASYRVHDEDDTALGQHALGRFGAILIELRQPLAPGVSVSADSKQYSWSFTIASHPAVDGKSN